MSTTTVWSDRSVLLTGATGFIGRELMLRLLNAGVERLILVIRGDDEARQAKLDRALNTVLATPEEVASAKERITVIRGDVAQPRLGLSSDDWDLAVAEANHVIHCAATVNFADSFSTHYTSNLGGTRYALDLAEAIQKQGRLKKFDYVGTAYVAGDRDGFIREDELDAGQGFNNYYEASKFQAEYEVMLRQDSLPVTRFRPSVVMGDQTTGRTSSFMMVYWLVKVYHDGWWRAIPAVPGTVVDIVPVNYVVDAIMAISPQEASLSKAFHLAAGPEHATSVDELCKLVQAFFNGKPVILMPFNLYTKGIRPILEVVTTGKLNRILSKGKVYDPYFRMRKIFDVRNTETALELTNVRPISVPEYFNRLFEFAMATDWGKKPLPAGFTPSGDVASGKGSLTTKES